MRRSVILATVLATVLVLVLPFFGGGGPSPLSPAAYAEIYASSTVVGTPTAAVTTGVVDADIAIAALTVVPAVVETAASTASSAAPRDTEHLAQKPVPPRVVLSAASRASGTAERRAAYAAIGQACPGAVGGSTGSAPGTVSSGGVGGTTTEDLASFANNYNAIRVANCLHPVPLSHFRYDSCMERRLFWMAQDPHPNPGNTWGHIGVHSKEMTDGVYYSEAVPSVGCDGNLAGGPNMTGAAAATRWWNSSAHRTSLYRPAKTGSANGVCIYFAMSHGDGNLGGEPYTFTRAAARYSGC